MVISLKTKLGTSKILIQKKALRKAATRINKYHKGKRVALITDENVYKYYQKEIEAAFPKALVMIVSPGEITKKLETVMSLVSEMIQAGITRSDVVVGIGGGMITDLSGFLASVYMRGMTFVSIPTTLLAMVDAAIGGKTGVNLAAKNSVGTFHLAESVIIDKEFLKTLPERELRTGFAEIIKYSCVLDSSLRKDLFEKQLDYEVIIAKSIKAKVAIVKKDTKEAGLRKVLNFGHTFGHAIEELSHYTLTHGEAISIGMVLADKVSNKLKNEHSNSEELLKLFGLPTELPKEITPDMMLKFILKDKKRSGNKLTFILAPKFGKYEFTEQTPKQLIKMIK